MITTRFRVKETIEAVQVVDRGTVNNVDELLDWCGAERAIRPGMAIALRVWTGTTMLAQDGDWIARDRHGFRVIVADEFERCYEAA